MKRIQVIKKILGKQMEPYGFEYGGYTHNRWTFKRIVNNVEQEIVLVKDLYCEELRIQISTSEQGIPLEIRDITEDERYRDKFSWKYSNEEEYIQVLQELSNLVVKYCIGKFKEISVPLFINVPTTDTYFKLYSQNEKLAKCFSEKYNIFEIEIEELLIYINSLLKVNQTEEFEQLKDLFLEISAFYGRRLIKQFEGEWNLNKTSKICSIIKMKGPRDYYDVLNRVVYYWEKGEGMELLNEYKERCKLYSEWAEACNKALNRY